ncbi:type II toxin-antitoxin system RelE/ParE family toxin [Parafrankia sp. BMG5.11]|uniref:type II toxin-antitoxin system RelE/ParE family toxin n=1 Tax=Parafrankia sp. BMG5.11 TaxID=222540 RepID=UPI0010401288|nr:type II toxin-antitoxin system RelE/ParE family toxin [Parafrankia sp. BMG5.11]TCJ33256.1 hypothetical protein E0504_39110 [Parafrankia sp. BMG5.11]
MSWDVVVHPDAVDELAKLPADERTAIDNALDKLRERGTDLPFSHTSAVVDADHLWELRPRGGDSPWRAFYRRMGAKLVVVGANGHHDRRKYKRAVALAVERLNDLKED